MNSHLERLDWFITQQLPEINTRECNREQILQGCAGDVLWMSERLLSSSASPRATCEIIGALGMFASSCIRAGLSSQHSPVPELLRICSRFAATVDHPPRDSIRTYVTWNGELLTGRWRRRFTNLPLEGMFLRLTFDCIQAYDKALHVLSGVGPTACSEALSRVRVATEILQRIQKSYFEFARLIPKSEATAWFSQFKKFFPVLTVAGKDWDPPSGAHVASIFELDLLLTTVDSLRSSQIRQRLRYLSSDQRDRIANALDHPCDLLQRLEIRFRPNKELLASLLGLIEQYSKCAATHYGMMKRFIGHERLSAANSGDQHVMAYSEVEGCYRARRSSSIALEIRRRLQTRGCP